MKRRFYASDLKVGLSARIRKKKRRKEDAAQGAAMDFSKREQQKEKQTE